VTGVPAAYFWILAGLVAALLVAEYRRSPAGLWATKPLAAAVYIAIAVAAGATESAYGWAILAALALSWWGDVLLIPKDRPGVFRAGILAFLAGHLAFAVAFVIRGVSPGALVIALGLMAIPTVTIHAWLADRVPAELKGAVVAYITVISVMFALAVATHAREPALLIVAGAGLFWLSDLFVARDRFVKPGFVNRLVGLPLYFTAQVLLALSV
jgi:uncharacterized membrane protein YhhN